MNNVNYQAKFTEKEIHYQKKLIHRSLVKMWTLTSPVTLPSVSRPSWRSWMKVQCAHSRRKRRHVRLAARSLMLVSSNDKFLKIMATCNTRWPSMSPMPTLRGGWKRGVQKCLVSDPSEKHTPHNRSVTTSQLSETTLGVCHHHIKGNESATGIRTSTYFGVCSSCLRWDLSLRCLQWPLSKTMKAGK